MNKENKKLYLPVKDKTNKQKLGNKTKARCQVGNKAKKEKNKFVERKGKKEKKE